MDARYRALRAMAVPNEAELVATTLYKRGGKVIDAVTKHNAFYNRIKKRNNIRTVDGGIAIIEPIQYQENPNFNWYNGYDQLPLSPAEVISSGQWSPKQAACSVVMSGRERAQNAGAEKVIDLWGAKIDNAETTMENGMQLGLLSDGTGSGGKILTGLDAAVPTDPSTGTYGGIDRASWTFWRSQLATGTTATSVNILALLTPLWLKLVRGADNPDLALAGTTIYTALEANMQNLVRITDPSLAEAGIESIRYKGADVVYESGMTATDLWLLNTRYIFLRPYAGRNMTWLDPRQRWSVNQDAVAQILVFMGNLTVSSPALQGRLVGA